LLYHLANNGPEAKDWLGVSRLLQAAGLNAVPAARVAVFVGTEFDPIAGRGGADGTPIRKTPWGEIAFQLGGASALAVLAEHEKQMTQQRVESLAPIVLAQVTDTGVFPTMAEVERAMIVAAFERSNRRPLEAARLLGIGKTTVYRKLRAMGEAAA
jgi:DNA-binding protein Fis